MKEQEKTSILEIKNLSYAYDNQNNALKDVNLNIYEGEKIAVIGANGAGKSTLFLNLNGVLRSEYGEILYRGQVMTRKNVNEFRKNIGIVFQDADNQIIASTVQAEVSFGPMNLKLPREEVKRRVNMALAYMDIVEFKDRPPHYLSGGEKKRVSIADIIAMQSEIIIFDEPTVALDPVNTMMFEEVLKQLSNENKTLIISTHDVDFVYKWAERVLVFCEGEVIADGKPREVFENKSVVHRAHLKRSMLLDVTTILKKSEIFKKFEEESDYPKSIEEFEKLIGNRL